MTLIQLSLEDISSGAFWDKVYSIGDVKDVTYYDLDGDGRADNIFVQYSDGRTATLVFTKDKAYLVVASPGIAKVAGIDTSTDKGRQTLFKLVLLLGIRKVDAVEAGRDDQIVSEVEAAASGNGQLSPLARAWLELVTRGTVSGVGKSSDLAVEYIDNTVSYFEEYARSLKARLEELEREYSSKCANSGGEECKKLKAQIDQLRNELAGVEDSIRFYRSMKFNGATAVVLEDGTLVIYDREGRLVVLKPPSVAPYTESGQTVQVPEDVSKAYTEVNSAVRKYLAEDPIDAWRAYITGGTTQLVVEALKREGRKVVEVEHNGVKTYVVEGGIIVTDYGDNSISIGTVGSIAVGNEEVDSALDRAFKEDPTLFATILQAFYRYRDAVSEACRAANNSECSPEQLKSFVDNCLTGSSKEGACSGVKEAYEAYIRTLGDVTRKALEAAGAKELGNVNGQDVFLVGNSVVVVSEDGRVLARSLDSPISISDVVKVRDENGNLVSIFDAYSSALEKLREAAKKGDAKSLASAANTVTRYSPILYADTVIEAVWGNLSPEDRARVIAMLASGDYSGAVQYALQRSGVDRDELFRSIGLRKVGETSVTLNGREVRVTAYVDSAGNIVYVDESGRIVASSNVASVADSLGRSQREYGEALIELAEALRSGNRERVDEILRSLEEKYGDDVRGLVQTVRDVLARGDRAAIEALASQLDVLGRETVARADALRTVFTQLLFNALKSGNTELLASMIDALARNDVEKLYELAKKAGINVDEVLSNARASQGFVTNQFDPCTRAAIRDAASRLLGVDVERVEVTEDGRVVVYTRDGKIVVLGDELIDMLRNFVENFPAPPDAADAVRGALSDYLGAVNTPVAALIMLSRLTSDEFLGALADALGLQYVKADGKFALIPTKLCSDDSATCQRINQYWDQLTPEQRLRLMTGGTAPCPDDPSRQCSYDEWIRSAVGDAKQQVIDMLTDMWNYIVRGVNTLIYGSPREKLSALAGLATGMVTGPYLGAVGLLSLLSLVPEAQLGPISTAPIRWIGEVAAREFEAVVGSSLNLAGKLGLDREPFKYGLLGLSVVADLVTLGLLAIGRFVPKATGEVLGRVRLVDVVGAPKVEEVATVGKAGIGELALNLTPVSDSVIVTAKNVLGLIEDAAARGAKIVEVEPLKAVPKIEDIAKPEHIEQIIARLAQSVDNADIANLLLEAQSLVKQGRYADAINVLAGVYETAVRIGEKDVANRVPLLIRLIDEVAKEEGAIDVAEVLENLKASKPELYRLAENASVENLDEWLRGSFTVFEERPIDPQRVSQMIEALRNSVAQGDAATALRVLDQLRNWKVGDEVLGDYISRELAQQLYFRASELGRLVDIPRDLVERLLVALEGYNGPYRGDIEMLLVQLLDYLSNPRGARFDVELIRRLDQALAKGGITEPIAEVLRELVARLKKEYLGFVEGPGRWIGIPRGDKRLTEVVRQVSVRAGVPIRVDAVMRLTVDQDLPWVLHRLGLISEDMARRVAEVLARIGGDTAPTLGELVIRLRPTVASRLIEAVVKVLNPLAWLSTKLIRDRPRSVLDYVFKLRREYLKLVEKPPERPAVPGLVIRPIRAGSPAELAETLREIAKRLDGEAGELVEKAAEAVARGDMVEAFDLLRAAIAKLEYVPDDLYRAYIIVKRRVAGSPPLRFEEPRQRMETPKEEIKPKEEAPGGRQIAVTEEKPQQVEGRGTRVEVRVEEREVGGRGGAVVLVKPEEAIRVIDEVRARAYHGELRDALTAAEEAVKKGDLRGAVDALADALGRAQVLEPELVPSILSLLRLLATQALLSGEYLVVPPHLAPIIAIPLWGEPTIAKPSGRRLRQATRVPPGPGGWYVGGSERQRAEIQETSQYFSQLLISLPFLARELGIPFEELAGPLILLIIPQIVEAVPTTQLPVAPGVKPLTEAPGVQGVSGFTDVTGVKPVQVQPQPPYQLTAPIQTQPVGQIQGATQGTVPTSATPPITPPAPIPPIPIFPWIPWPRPPRPLRPPQPPGAGGAATRASLQSYIWPVRRERVVF